MLKKIKDLIPSGSVETSIDDIICLLDVAHDEILDKDYYFSFKYLETELTKLYDRINPKDMAVIRAEARLHPLFSLCQQDPFTNRAFSKPRGYAGDAVMLDYIYNGAPPEGTSSPGAGIFTCTTRGSMGFSVLYRKNLLNAYINESIVKTRSARILSVAAGHCREVHNSLALSDFFNGEMIAMDQDMHSCEEVDTAYNGRIKSVVMGIKELFKSTSSKFDTFDLIYSAGLYDYLPSDIATKLSNKLKSLLKPNGRLIIGNFNQNTIARGYMDFIMDWNLIYRDKVGLQNVMGDLTGYDVNTFNDPHSNVSYVEILKK